MAMSCGARSHDRVDVLPDRTEVGPRRVQVVRLAELLGRHDLLHLADAGVVEEGVADHQQPAGRVGQIAERFAAGDVQRHRLLDQHVTAVVERARDQRLVRRRRRRDHDRVDVVAREDLVETVAGGDGAVALRTEREAIGTLIADDGQLGARQIAQDARVVRSPVAESDECETNALGRRGRG